MKSDLFFDYHLECGIDIALSWVLYSVDLWNYRKKSDFDPLFSPLQKTVRNLNLNLFIKMKIGGQDHFFCYNFANLPNIKLGNVSYESYIYPIQYGEAKIALFIE